MGPQVPIIMFFLPFEAFSSSSQIWEDGLLAAFPLTNNSVSPTSKMGLSFGRVKPLYLEGTPLLTSGFFFEIWVEFSAKLGGNSKKERFYILLG